MREERKNMKKIIPILLVGILIFSGLGAVASSNNIESGIKGSQAQIQAEAKCGFGVKVTITNVGTETFEGDILCNLTISGLIYKKSSYHNYRGFDLSPGESLKFRELKAGIGPTTVTLKVDWGEGEVSGSTNGFMFLFLILGAPPIVIP
jgi:hypothetical protein